MPYLGVLGIWFLSSELVAVALAFASVKMALRVANRKRATSAPPATYSTSVNPWSSPRKLATIVFNWYHLAFLPISEESFPPSFIARLWLRAACAPSVYAIIASFLKPATSPAAPCSRPGHRALVSSGAPGPTSSVPCRSRRCSAGQPRAIGLQTRPQAAQEGLSQRIEEQHQDGGEQTHQHRQHQLRRRLLDGQLRSLGHLGLHLLGRRSHRLSA